MFSVSIPTEMHVLGVDVAFALPLRPRKLIVQDVVEMSGACHPIL